MSGGLPWQMKLTNGATRVRIPGTGGNGFGHTAASEWYSSGLDRLTLHPDIFQVERIDDENIVIDIRNVMVLGTSAGAFINHFKYQDRGRRGHYNRPYGES